MSCYEEEPYHVEGLIDEEEQEVVDDHSVKRSRKERLRRFDWWNSMGSPKHVTAPMVDLSELAFRMMTRKYGADLCYTPMLNASNFADSAVYRKQNFFTHVDDQPLIAQFAGDDGETVVRAARYVQDQVSAVDLNLGCPQAIAKRGHYGAYLLEEPDLVCDVVGKMVTGLECPVTCKIRLLGSDQEGIEETARIVRRLEALGIDALCVHGRTKDMKGQQTGKADWEAIRFIRERFPEIPMILNGGIEKF